MARHVIHISEEEAATGFASLMAEGRAGAEVIIERDAQPVAVLHRAGSERGRMLSESIALAEAHAKELGYEPTLVPDSAAHPAEIIRRPKPRNISRWD